MKKELKALGLTDKEIEIYLAGLKSGPLSVQNLAQIAEVKRTTVYDVLERLKRLKLVNQTIKGKKRFYEIASPSRFLTFVQQEKEDIFAKEEGIMKIISNLEAMSKKTEFATDVTIYEGWEGIEEVMLMFAKMEAPFFSLYSSHYLSFLDKKMLQKIEATVLKINKARLPLKNKLYVITDHSDISRDIHLFNSAIREIRYFPKNMKLPAMIDVCEDKVALSSLREEGRYGSVVIQNTLIAETVRFMINTIWQSLDGEDLSDLF